MKNSIISLLICSQKGYVFLKLDSRGRHQIWNNLLILLQSVEKSFLWIPPFLTIGLGVLIYFDVYYLSKYILEWMALIILSITFICVFFRLWINKHPFFLWALIMLSILFMREIHFRGSSYLVYIFLFVLFYSTLKRLNILKSFLLNTRTLTLLIIGFVFYGISVTIDQRWWQHLPWEETVHVTLEESLEVIGHLTIGFALLFAPHTLHEEYIKNGEDKYVYYWE